ncbi:MAG: hypothetical protein U0838_17025 [Chloroflexota bacterium]
MSDLIAFRAEFTAEPYWRGPSPFHFLPPCPRTQRRSASSRRW